CRPRSLPGAGRRGSLPPYRARPRRAARACSEATSWRISSAYRKPHTRRQHPAALTDGMIRSEPARTAARRTRSATTGVTIYGCGQDEAALFRELAPALGIVPTMTEAAVSDAN